MDDYEALVYHDKQSQIESLLLLASNISLHKAYSWQKAFQLFGIFCQAQRPIQPNFQQICQLFMQASLSKSYFAQPTFCYKSSIILSIFLAKNSNIQTLFSEIGTLVFSQDQTHYSLPIHPSPNQSYIAPNMFILKTWKVIQMHTKSYKLKTSCICMLPSPLNFTTEKCDFHKNKKIAVAFSTFNSQPQDLAQHQPLFGSQILQITVKPDPSPVKEASEVLIILGENKNRPKTAKKQ